MSHLRLLSYLAFLACPTQGSSRYPCSPFSPQKTNSCQLWGKQTEAWKSPSLMTALNQTSPFAICWRARICKLPCFKGKSYTKLNRKKKKSLLAFKDLCQCLETAEFLNDTQCLNSTMNLSGKKIQLKPFKPLSPR